MSAGYTLTFIGPPSISQAASEYVRVRVYSVKNSAVVDPTGLTGYMALTADATVPSVWTAATWETGDINGLSTTYYLKAIVGSGGIAPGTGNFYVWVKISDSPETIIRIAGQMEIV